MSGKAGLINLYFRYIFSDAKHNSLKTSMKLYFMNVFYQICIAEKNQALRRKSS